MKKVSRRRFLVVAGAGAGAVALFPGCEKEFTCRATGLSPTDEQIRSNSLYIDNSPDRSKTCLTCRYYRAAAEGQCGGCTLIKGPTHPQGYCRLWMQKTA